jgi:hypothetical protein
MLPMTRHKHTHTGLVTSSLSQLLLTAMLRALAMLMSNVASTLQMIIRRCPAIGTRAMPADLPGETSDTNQEANPVAASDHSSNSHGDLPFRKRAALSGPHSSHCGLADQWLPALRFVAAGMTSEDTFSRRATATGSLLRLSRESGLAQHRDHQLIVPLVPMNVGTQGSPRPLSGPEAAFPRLAHYHSWIPAFAGMSGDESAPILAP